MPRPPAALAALLLATGCTPAQTDGIDPQGKAFDAVAPDEAVTMLGTEPFWSLKVEGDQALWTTPDSQPGTPFAVTRFAGNGGLSYSGTLDGKPFTATLSPGACSDGMSDRRYPFVATAARGGETLKGCGHTTRQPPAGDPAP